MGLSLGTYYKWLYGTKNILGSTNYLITQDSNGDLFWTKNLTGDVKKMLYLREKMQYMVLIEGEN